MDLEDFDMDQFMNMWVGEMMEDGGVVDDMMQSVLPWSNDEATSSQSLLVSCPLCRPFGSPNVFRPFADGAGVAAIEEKMLQFLEETPWWQASGPTSLGFMLVEHLTPEIYISIMLTL